MELLLAMPAGKMHADELEIDEGLVRRLVAGQFPQWAGLDIEPVRSAGTDNAIFRLGDYLAARLPRIYWAAGQAEKENRWLPGLAPHLPLAVPVPVALGEPGEGYPWRWSVCQWLEGENAAPQGFAGAHQAAEDLAKFINALHEIDPSGGPAPGEHNSFRGVPLAQRDAQTRSAIASLSGMLDAAAAAEAWEAALSAPAWHGPPVWIHGDLQPGNLLARNGRLSAVIDFGCLGVGDPACDITAAWSLFKPGAREAFREALEVDAAAWARGRGWALSVGLIALPYYQDTNPELAGIARRAIEEVLADHRSSGLSSR